MRIIKLVSFCLLVFPLIGHTNSGGEPTQRGPRIRKVHLDLVIGGNRKVEVVINVHAKHKPEAQEQTAAECKKANASLPIASRSLPVIYDALIQKKQHEDPWGRGAEEKFILDREDKGISDLLFNLNSSLNTRESNLSLSRFANLLCHQICL